MILSPRDALLFSIAAQSPIAEAGFPLPYHMLRGYQLDMLLEALALMQRGHRRILLQLPTGGGKTVIASALLGGIAAIGMTGEFLVHRKELINQTSASFAEHGLQHGFIATKRPMDLSQPVILSGVQTLVNRLPLILPPNLVVVDEAHHATAGTWERVLQHYGDAFIIGLTATPQRLDGHGLGDIFDVIVGGPSVEWLIGHGYLSPYEFYAPAIPDMNGVKETAGEFNKKATSAIMSRPKVVGDIVEHYLRLCPGEQGIVFAASRENSQKLADAFRAEGVMSMHVDGDTPDDERDMFDAAFRAGDIRVACNVDLFGEGYDVPNVSYVGDASPSKSIVKVAQRWGRCLRPAKGKTRGVICDHAGNALPTIFGGRGHGLPDDDREWTLEGRQKRPTGVGSDAVPITQCKRCFRVYPSSLSHCPGCEEPAPPLPRIVPQTQGRLTKLEREELQRQKTAQRKAEERACTSYHEFYTLAQARRYDWPHEWARKQCELRRLPRV